MALTVSKRSGGEPSAGFLSAKEIVQKAKLIDPSFNQSRLWLLVALGLIPEPLLLLPTTSRLIGAFGSNVGDRISECLRRRAQPLSIVRTQLPEFQPFADGALPVSTELRWGSSNPREPELENAAFAMDLVSALAGTAVGGTNLMYQLFAVYVSQVYFPTNAVGRAARRLCLSAERAGWGDNRAEIEIAQGIVSDLLPAMSADPTLDEIFRLLGEAETVFTSRFNEFLAWHDRPEIKALAASMARPIAHRMSVAEAWAFAWHQSRVKTVISFLMSFPSAWAGVLLSIFLWSCSLITPERVLREIGNSISLVSFAVGAAVAIYSLSRRIQRSKSKWGPGLIEAIDLLLYVVVVYAIAYWLASFSGGISVASASANGPRPLPEMIYFSMVVISTTGFGDILPVSGVARLLVGCEIVTGMLFGLYIFGVVVSKLTSGSDTE